MASAKAGIIVTSEMLSITEYEKRLRLDNKN
jgi:hypothetical protein